MMYWLDRTVTIRATPETVFRYFQESARWANWWGAGSTIDARPGGKVYVRYPNGVEASGEVLEVHPPERIVFTYGYASGEPVAPGASKVTIRLEADREGTRLHLRHEFTEQAACDQHVQGWRFQLSVFANAVANEVFGDAADKADAWFAAWAIPDDAERRAAFAAICEDSAAFHDRYSSLVGLDEINAHAGASQRFMPGVRLARSGGVRQCQGTALADWTAGESMRGTNVFGFSAAGKIRIVTGLWA